MARNIIKVGPWGGSGGNKWYDGSFNGVREITLRYGIYIDSITVVYDKNGMPVAGDQHGGPGGHNTCTISLRYPEEFLTVVSGYITHNGNVISSLRFETNQRSFGPFGGAEIGTSFSIPIDGGSIVGFLGRSGLYLDAIGFACAPLNIPQAKSKSKLTSLCCLTFNKT